jgi:hypothetical protein
MNNSDSEIKPYDTDPSYSSHIVRDTIVTANRTACYLASAISSLQKIDKSFEYDFMDGELKKICDFKDWFETALTKMESILKTSSILNSNHTNDIEYAAIDRICQIENELFLKGREIVEVDYMHPIFKIELDRHAETISSLIAEKQRLDEFTDSCPGFNWALLDGTSIQHLFAQSSQNHAD